MAQKQLTSYVIEIELVNGEQEKYHVKLDPRKTIGLQVERFIRQQYGTPPVQVRDKSWHRKQ